MKRIVRLIVCAASILCASMAHGASPTDEEITQKVERITSDPRYYWLKNRAEGPAPTFEEQGEGDGSTVKTVRNRGKSTSDETSGCGYQPTPPKDAPEFDQDLLGIDCDCGPSIGSSCECGRVGGGHLIGYAISGILLILLIYSVVRLIVHRPPGFRESSLGLEKLIDKNGAKEDIAAIPATLLLSRAFTYAAQGNYKSAVGLCYLATLSHLHQSELASLHESLTNMAILRSLRSRGGPIQPVAKIFSVFEDVFFGHTQAEANHWLQCKTILEVHLEVLPPSQ